MFTVKWISPGGDQKLYEARGKVSFSPYGPENTPRAGDPLGQREQPAHVRFTDGKGVRRLLDFGEVHVLNERAEIVGHYPGLGLQRSK